MTGMSQLAGSIPEEQLAAKAVSLTEVYLVRYSGSRERLILLTDGVEEWLNSCHPTKAERDKIIAKFRFVFELLRSKGLGIGKPYIDHIEGYSNLWESRVDHQTGAYRAFFGLAADGTVIIVAHGAVKKRNRFPAREYRLAAEKVREAVEIYDAEERAKGG